MKRKDFLKKSCSFGICACAMPAILGSNNLSAQETNTESWQVRFSKDRFSILSNILDEKLDEKTRNQILENLGRECSKRSKIERFENDLQGFIDHLKNDWGENATYDEEKKLIRVEGSKSECFCPMFNHSTVSKSICQCSVGWQSQTYETITGLKAEAKCIESVITGGKRCVFEIQLPG